MKILINTDQIYLHGGIEKVMATKVNYWSNLPETEVYIVTTEQKEKLPCYELDPRVKLIDLGVNYDRSKSYFSFQNLQKSISHYQKQKKVFKNLRPEIIISPNYNFDHYWLPLIKQKAQLLKERHSSRYLEEVQRKSGSFISKLKFAINDWIETKYDRIVVLNKDEVQYVKSNNAVVIPNPVELSNLRADVSNKRIIAAGRISPVKGFNDLIEAFSRAHVDFPDWQLHFYGQDYLGTQKQLQKQIGSLNLSQSIIFKGNVDHLPTIMANYSIYAMTSETECFPMVLLEALSVGLPVVSYDSPTGPRNILINGKDSYLVPYKKIDIFANRLKELMNDELLRKTLADQGVENVSRFSIETVMTKWTALFKKS